MNNPRLSLAIEKTRQAMQLIQEAGDILTAEILAQENPELPVSTTEDSAPPMGHEFNQPRIRCPQCGKLTDSHGLCICDK